MPYRRTADETADAYSRHDYLPTAGRFAMRHNFVSMYSSSTGMRTPETVVRGAWSGADDGFAGEGLLLNYRPANGNLGFQVGISLFFEPDAVLAACHADLGEDLRGTVPLPRPKAIRAGLTAVVSSRRSGRRFSGDPVSREDLSTILHHAQGVSGELPAGGHGTIKVRNAPSGGGLYPVTLFVEAVNVTGVAPGRYEYLPHAHVLRPVRGAATGDLFTSPDFDVKQVGFLLIFGYDLLHNSRKYGDSGLVFGLIEVGAILQNVHLARTALALGGCDQGGYDKQRIERGYRLDGLNRHVVHLTVIGQEG